MIVFHERKGASFYIKVRLTCTNFHIFISVSMLFITLQSFIKNNKRKLSNTVST